MVQGRKRLKTKWSLVRRVVKVTQIVAVTGDNKELWPHSKSDSSSDENEGSNKVALWLIDYAIFNSFLVYKNLNPDSKLKYKAFLMNVAKAWATVQMVAAPESGTDLERPGPSTPTPRRRHVDTPGRLSGNIRKHTLV
jgi:hypothetical protein